MSRSDDPNDIEAMDEQRKSLTKQLFQLAYFGHISPEFASSLEITERNYLYTLLAKQLESEKKANEAENQKIKSKMPSVRRR